MGRQIQIRLSLEDEEKLIEHLSGRYPSVRVIDRLYPPDWDRQSLARSLDATSWTVIDTRVTAVLLGAATQLPSYKGRSGSWQIRSKAASCIDWDRNRFQRGQFPLDGRLYLNTHPDRIWTRVSSEIGDEIAKIFDCSCRWIRRQCKNCSEGRIGVWVSHSEVDAYLREIAERRAKAANRPKDPRDASFYKLHRQQRHKLSIDELETYLSYCDRMIEFLGKDKVSAASWQDLRGELIELRECKT